MNKFALVLAASLFLSWQLSTEARELFPNSQAREIYNQALQWQQQQKWVKAEQAYHQALALHPHWMDAHNNLGSVYLSQGQAEKAVQSFHQALQRWRVDADLYYNLGLAYEMLGQEQRAQRFFQLALQLAPEHPAQNKLAPSLDPVSRTSKTDTSLLQVQSLRAQKKTAQALTLLDQMLAEQPQSGRLHYYRAQLSTDLNTRLRHLDQSLRSLPHHIGAHHLRAQTLQALQRPAEARQSLIQLLEIRPRYAPAYDDLAQLARAQGQSREAAHWLLQLVSLEPHYKDAAFRLGRYLYWLGYSEQALHYLKQQSQAAPHLDASLLISDIYLQQMRLQEAERSLQVLLQRWPQAPELHQRLAAVALHTKNKAAFERHISRAANSAQTRFLQAQFALQEGRSAEALRRLEPLWESTQKPEYAQVLVLALLKSGRHDEALSIAQQHWPRAEYLELKQALAKMPTHPSKGHLHALDSSRR